MRQSSHVLQASQVKRAVLCYAVLRQIPLYQRLPRRPRPALWKVSRPAEDSHQPALCIRVTTPILKRSYLLLKDMNAVSAIQCITCGNLTPSMNGISAHLACPSDVVFAIVYKARRLDSFHPSVQFTPSSILYWILHISGLFSLANDLATASHICQDSIKRQGGKGLVLYIAADLTFRKEAASGVELLQLPWHIK